MTARAECRTSTCKRFSLQGLQVSFKGFFGKDHFGHRADGFSTLSPIHLRPGIEPRCAQTKSECYIHYAIAQMYKLTEIFFLIYKMLSKTLRKMMNCICSDNFFDLFLFVTIKNIAEQLEAQILCK